VTVSKQQMFSSLSKSFQFCSDLQLAFDALSKIIFFDQQSSQITATELTASCMYYGGKIIQLHMSDN
jgi:hypothetical protein